MSSAKISGEYILQGGASRFPGGGESIPGGPPEINPAEYWV